MSTSDSPSLHPSEQLGPSHWASRITADMFTWNATREQYHALKWGGSGHWDRKPSVAAADILDTCIYFLVSHPEVIFVFFKDIKNKYSMHELYPIRTCAASITAVIYEWVLNFF